MGLIDEMDFADLFTDFAREVLINLVPVPAVVDEPETPIGPWYYERQNDEDGMMLTIRLKDLAAAGLWPLPDDCAVMMDEVEYRIIAAPVVRGLVLIRLQEAV